MLADYDQYLSALRDEDGTPLYGIVMECGKQIIGVALIRAEMVRFIVNQLVQLVQLIQLVQFVQLVQLIQLVQLVRLVRLVQSIRLVQLVDYS